MRTVEITREPVELYKILKFEGLVASGGEAKSLVAAGEVLVNGQIETRKRKKIVSGDTIEFGGELLQVQLQEGSSPGKNKSRRGKLAIGLPGTS